MSSAKVNSNKHDNNQSKTKIANNKKNNDNTKPSLMSIWCNAIRPHTLTASMSPCFVGGCCCLCLCFDNDSSSSNGCFKTFFMWIVFCILIQIGTNLHNDLSDYMQGADNDDRVGQPRAVQKGWISIEEMKYVCSIILLFAFIVGMNIIYFILNDDVKNQFWFFFIIVTSIFNAFAYTGGPWPLGYIGLSNCSIAYSGYAEIVCFLYFGCVATLAMPLLVVTRRNDNSLTLEIIKGEGFFFYYAVLYATQVGCLASAILVVNNLRDRKTDARAGKRTLIVQYGKKFGKLEYTLLVSMPYVLVVAECYYCFSGALDNATICGCCRMPDSDAWSSSSNHNKTCFIQMLPLLSVPFAFKQIKSIHTKDGASLNIHVGMTAMLQLCFCLLLCIKLYLLSSSLY